MQYSANKPYFKEVGGGMWRKKIEMLAKVTEYDIFFKGY